MITHSLRSLVPSSRSSSSQANTPQAGSSSGCRITYTQGSSRCVGTQPLLSPKCSCGYGTKSPDIGNPLCELRAADTWESSSFPLSALFLPSPKTTVSLPFPCTLFPPDPHHEWHFLIFSRSPHFPAMNCYVCVQTSAFLVYNEFMLLSS